MRVETIGDATLYLGDCLEILPTLDKVDAVVTDPPYPDYFADDYKYKDGLLQSLNIKYGFVFWSAKCEFPLAHSAVHIWDKKTGAASEYEKIYEINGQGNYKVFRHYLINSSVAANYGGDINYAHSSQKPIRLMKDIVDRAKGHTILDPFMGSGTTGVACANLGRKFIGIEIEEKYFDIACERITAAQAQGRLFE